ncbi:hypothetical protein GB937_004081 [Aspergillus fischeri]|nr:hypothetical protein GB937_004081 [Aspergillus fischeri]
MTSGTWKLGPMNADWITSTMATCGVIRLWSLTAQCCSHVAAAEALRLQPSHDESTRPRRLGCRSRGNEENRPDRQKIISFWPLWRTKYRWRESRDRINDRHGISIYPSSSTTPRPGRGRSSVTDTRWPVKLRTQDPDASSVIPVCVDSRRQQEASGSLIQQS